MITLTVAGRPTLQQQTASYAFLHANHPTSFQPPSRRPAALKIEAACWALKRMYTSTIGNSKYFLQSRSDRLGYQNVINRAIVALKDPQEYV